jgi:hypothetical protein
MKNLIVILVVLSSCGLETNTVDPQVSNNIAFSKQHHLFIREYVTKPTADTTIPLDEAWLEYVWKNKSGDAIENLGSVQLVIKLKTKSHANQFGIYLLDWYLQSPKLGYFGSGNGVYDLSIPDSIYPTSFVVEAYKIDTADNKRKIGELELRER